MRYRALFGGLGSMYTIPLRLIGNRVVDFLFVRLNWTFGALAVTAEALRAKIDWKSALCNGVSQYSPNFHVERDVPTDYFPTPYNLVADSFHTKKLCSRLSLIKLRLHMGNDCFTFLSPLWGLRFNVRCVHLKPCWERPTRLNSTQLNSTQLKLLSFRSSEHFQNWLSWVELSYVGRSEHAENW